MIKEQEILLICKGKYSEEKYPTVYAALCEYWGRRTLIDMVEVDVHMLMKYCILPTARFYLSSEEWSALIEATIEKYSEETIEEFEIFLDILEFFNFIELDSGECANLDYIFI